MKNHKPLITVFMFLLFGAKLCVAQQEDTIKLKFPNIKPELIIPSQPMQSNQSLMPSKLGLDGLEYIPYTPTTLPTEDTLIADLTVDNFTKFYYKDFLKWEKDTYGVNLNIGSFVKKNGRYMQSTFYRDATRKRSVLEKEREAPYLLHPDVERFLSVKGIPINWAPTKHDIWFKKNFSWESRALQFMGYRVDSLGGRSIAEAKNLQRVDSIIAKNKLDSTGQYNPTKVNYKKRIKQIRKDIRLKAKLDLK